MEYGVSMQVRELNFGIVEACHDREFGHMRRRLNETCDEALLCVCGLPLNIEADVVECINRHGFNADMLLHPPDEGEQLTKINRREFTESWIRKIEVFQRAVEGLELCSTYSERKQIALGNARCE